MSIESATTDFLTLATLPKGRAATIARIAPSKDGSLTEQRLLEIGFEEGKKVEVVHFGLFGDPMAVRVDRQTIALRRREANLVEVAPFEG